MSQKVVYSAKLQTQNDFGLVLSFFSSIEPATGNKFTHEDSFSTDPRIIGQIFFNTDSRHLAKLCHPLHPRVTLMMATHERTQLYDLGCNLHNYISI